VCCLPDSDGDGAFDAVSFCTPSNSGPHADNCPLVPNSNQDDADKDGQGDSCDTDDDNDGIQDTNDNCRAVVNTNQEDTDNDEVGNDCDNCPLNANTDQADEDGDGNGDICDLDNDKDFNLDFIDNCPEDYNPNQEDMDGDGVGDVCDNCPEESNANQADANNNFIGDACDSILDDDKDGVVDIHDNCPSRPNSDQLDTDEDGLGDECDDDCDGDGIADVDDNCCCQPNPNQTPSSFSQRGAVCTADFDGDGVIDSEDICPEDRTKWTTSFKDVSFHDMGQTSTNPSAVWEIHDDGLEVAQLASSQASMALSDTSFGPVRFSGYMYIVGEDEGIEGAAGVVFNYQNNKNFNLLSAVRTGQNKGFWKLTRVSSATGHPSDALKDAIYMRDQPNHSDVAGETLIPWKSTELDWEAGVAHYFSISVDPETQTIGLIITNGPYIQVNTTIVEMDALRGGRLGMYAQEQPLVYWTGLRTECFTPPRVHYITCDDNLTAYFDGVEAPHKASMDRWEETSALSYGPTTNLLAVSCTSNDGGGGIIASGRSGRYFSDGHKWRCSAELEADWMQPGFDDSAWEEATELGPSMMAPWGPRSNIDPRASWIWTDDPTDATVYCRRTLD